MLADLLASEGVIERMHLNGLVGVMALHGGLEEHTAEMVDALAAASPASSYVVIQPDDLRWHVPSVRYDPGESDRLFRFLAHVRLTVSLHGFGRTGMEDTVLLGGTNRRLAGALGAAIARTTSLRVVTDVAAIPDGLRGMSPRNPVNLPELGGVQLELSPGARTPPVRAALVAAVADVLDGEQRSLRG